MSGQAAWVRLTACLGMIVALSAVGCGRRELERSGPGATARGVESGPGGISFRESGPASGVDFVYRNGREAERYTILESLGGGVGFFDYDGDGWPDLFFPGGGWFEGPSSVRAHPAALYRYTGNGRFENATTAADAAADRCYTHGVAVADFDNDGFSDLLVTGYGTVQLLHNQGDGTFCDVTRQMGLDETGWTTAAGWGDFDADGNVDLVLVRYVDWSPANDPRCPPQQTQAREVCSPIQFNGVRDSLYRNSGQGGFEDRSELLETDSPGKGLGLLIADLDLDGSLDLYVANDTTPNFLYRNEGGERFREVGGLQGAALDPQGTPTGSMGVDLGDFDLDGLPDIGVANYDSELFGLYRRAGRVFVHASDETGLAAVGTLMVGWGTAFADLDCDGDEDLVVSNGHVLYAPRNSPARQLPLVLRNDSGRFVRVEFPADHDLGRPHHGRGLAVADLDGDGRLDLAVSRNNEPASLLVNATDPAAGWCGFRLIGRRCNRDAIGARVQLLTTFGRQTRQVKGSCSYLSQGDRRVHFGLGAARPQSVTVHWSSGRTQEVERPAAGSYTVLIEPL